MSAAPQVIAADLARLLDRGLELKASGAAECPLAFVDLDVRATDVSVREAARAAGRGGHVLIGVMRQELDSRVEALATALTCTLVTGEPSARWQVRVSDVDRAVTALEAAVADSPVASTTLDGVLRLTGKSSVEDGLVAESLAYSVLLTGREFARWLAGRGEPRHSLPPGQPVIAERRGDELEIVLNWPARHNAVARPVRDGLIEAFDLVLADRTIQRVSLSGAGASFCSGGDIDEFGTSADASVAHLIRLDRSVAARLNRCRDRVTAKLHGACLGAGIEIASFARRVLARPDTSIRLPEIAMGLIPGAGGTVGITRRIGRWRTAYLALAGEAIDVETALDWGLIDGRCSD